MIQLIFGLVIIVCYGALWQPEKAFKRGWRRWALWFIVVGYGSLSILAATGTTPFWSLGFIIFPILYAVLLRNGFRRLTGRLTRSRGGQLILIFVLLWFSEIFAALDIASYDPLGRHMLVYIGFYIGQALVVSFFLSRWRYTFPVLFTIGGLWGVLVERQFAGITILASGDIFGFLSLASIIFPVYGFYLAGPYLLCYEECNTNTHTNRWQNLLLFVCLTVIPLLTWTLWTVLLGWLGLDTKVFVV